MNSRPVSRRARLVRAAFVFTAAAAVAFLTGCAGEKSEASAAGAAAPAATPVGVITVTPRPVTLTRELPGRTSAYRVAEVRARINGIVQKRLFTEGAEVSAGDVLFEIDPAPYQAALDSAKANLARAEASLVSAEAQAKRFEGLVATNAVSKQNYDDARAAQLALAAEVAAARAAVQSAEINLGYTRVTSPIDGRIGQAQVTEGAYVQQATATLLAVVQQLDPLYVDLSQSADEVLGLKQALSSGRLKADAQGGAPLTVILDGNRPYEHTGSLQFSDVSVSPTTGTVSLRGTVPNPDDNLLPGMFVRARLNEGTDPNAILLPQSVVSRNSKGEATVLLINAEGKAELRVITAPRAIGSDWLVTSGLKPGDRVISDQLQKVRPGAPVTAAAPTAAAAAN